MDSFGGILDGPRAHGAFALRTVMSPPWSWRILAESPLTVLAIVKGYAWVMPDVGDPTRLDVGDVAVTRAPDHYNVADDPATPTTVVIHPGQRCCSPKGESVKEAMTHGVRTWGNDPEGSTLMLVGARFGDPLSHHPRLLSGRRPGGAHARGKPVPRDFRA